MTPTTIRALLHPWVLSLGILALSACGGNKPEATTPANGPSAGPSDHAVEAAPSQVEQGGSLYGQYCAACHGADGTGSADAPPVVGPAALPLHAPQGAKRQVEFATAGDVLRWVRVAMPADAPASLSDAEYAAIIAFALQANGVDMSGTHLDEATADTMRLH